jgi:hypothetical protein
LNYATLVLCRRGLPYSATNNPLFTHLKKPLPAGQKIYIWKDWQPALSQMKTAKPAFLTFDENFGDLRPAKGVVYKPKMRKTRKRTLLTILYNYSNFHL